MMVRRVARHICQVAHFCLDNQRCNPGMDERGSRLLQRSETDRRLYRRVRGLQTMPESCVIKKGEASG